MRLIVSAIQSGLDADIMFLWDDVFDKPLRDGLNVSAASVGNQQQEALMLLQVRAVIGDRFAAYAAPSGKCRVPVARPSNRWMCE